MNEEQNFRHRLERLEEDLSLLRAQWDAMQREKEVEVVKVYDAKEVLPPPLPSKENVASPAEKTRPVPEPKHIAQPTQQPEPPQKQVPQLNKTQVVVPEDTELRIGQTWAVRIGVVLLLTGFIFLGNYAWEHYISDLGALPRLLLLLTLALSTTVAGELMRKKERLHVFGQVVTAGGLAAVYYCAFASHHITRLKIIDSPIIGSLLLVATGLSILAYSSWRKLPVLCCAAIMMAFYGTIVQPIANTAMISALVVSVAATILCLKNGWRSVGTTGVICCYLAYVIWQGTVHEAEAFSAAAWYLVAYWLLFTVSILHPRAPWSINQQVAITAINHTALAALLSFNWQSCSWHEKTWLVHAILAAVVFGIALFLQHRRGRSLLCEAHFLQAFTLSTLAMLMRWPGETLPIALAVKGLALLIWCRRDARVVVEGSAYAILFLAILLGTQRGELLHHWSIPLSLAAIYFAAACVAPKDQDLRVTGRLILAAFATWKMHHTFATFPADSGLICTSGIALVVAVAYRHWREKFPAPEIYHMLMIAVLMSSIAAVMMLQNHPITLGVFATSTLLLWLHAHVACDRSFNIKSLDSKQYYAVLHAFAFWIFLGALMVFHVLPYLSHGSTALIALFSMVALHALACLHHGGALLRQLAPLFTFVVIALAMQGGKWEWLTASLVCLIYAATLTHPRIKHILLTIPLILGMLMITARLWNDGPWSTIAFLMLAGAIYLVRFLREDKVWRSASWLLVFFSFAHFTLADSNNAPLTYLGAACFFALLILRARLWQKPSSLNSKWAALLLGIVVACKLSFWANASGPAHALTLLWAVLAGAYFLLGFAMRERVMRILMLALLFCCMGKIFISVWELGTLMRIASFLVSGIVFLGLGYVYNKHPEWFSTKNIRSDSPASETTLT